LPQAVGPIRGSLGGEKKRDSLEKLKGGEVRGRPKMDAKSKLSRQTRGWRQLETLGKAVKFRGEEFLWGKGGGGGLGTVENFVPTQDLEILTPRKAPKEG